MPDILITNLRTHFSIEQGDVRFEKLKEPSVK